ncbi:MAG: hypothetical protein ACKOOE_07130 [Micrococcales bacterium]
MASKTMVLDASELAVIVTVPEPDDSVKGIAVTIVPLLESLRVSVVTPAGTPYAADPTTVTFAV